VGKYEQTWQTPYGSTRCSQWLNDMTVHQRFVASADMLSGARSNDGGQGVAPDGLVHRFAVDITDTCHAARARPITEIAVGIYLTERARWAP